MPNVCSAGADRNAGMVQCIPNTSAPSTKSQNWDGTFWCPACGVMLRLVGDTSFQTWWQCGDCGRTEGEPGATTLSESANHDHRSAVYQVLPEFRDLFEFAIGWSDILEESATETSVEAQAALPVDEAAERDDDAEYEQVDINSVLDAQLELGSLGRQGASQPLEASEEAPSDSSDEKVDHGSAADNWWNVEPTLTAPEVQEGEPGLLVALAAAVDVSDASNPPADTPSVQLESAAPIAEVRSSGDAHWGAAGGSSTESADAEDELAKLLKALCSPAGLDEISEQKIDTASLPDAPDVQAAIPENGSEPQKSATDDSVQCVDAPAAAVPSSDGSLATSVAYGDGQAHDQGFASPTRRRNRAIDEPVRTSLPPPAELISYAPLTRDALWIPPQRKLRNKHTAMALGLSAALMGVVALMGYRELGSMGAQLYGTAMRYSHEQTAIKSFAALRVPPPTPVALEQLLPKPPVQIAGTESAGTESASADIPIAQIESLALESVEASTASASSALSSAQPVRLTIAASYVPVQKTAQRSSVGVATRQEVAKVPSAKPRADEQVAPVAAKFDDSAAEGAITRAAEQANACRDTTTPKGAAVVTITFAPSGHVVTTSVSGPPFAGTATGSCIASTLYGIRVPPFAGTESVTLTRTLTIR